MVQSDEKNGGRNEVREQMRRRIQQAALACFSEKGLAGATMAEIARRAGVSPGALYLHFGSKQDLFDSLGRPDLDQPAARVRERRAQILAAALKVFSEKGYAAATMDHIAEEAGLSKAALYGHFAGKEELFLGVLREAPMTAGLEGLVHCSDDRSEAPFAAVMSSNVPEEALTELAKAYFRVHREPQRLELMRFVVAESMRDPEVADQVIERMVEQSSARVGEQLERLGLGEAEELYDSAEMFMGMLFSWILRHRLLGRAVEGDEIDAIEAAAARRIVRTFLSGLTANQSAPSGATTRKA